MLGGIWETLQLQAAVEATSHTRVKTFMGTREFLLLLACAKSRPLVGPIKDLVREGIDWHVVLKLAEQHGVRPMLLRSLQSVCWDAVPDATRVELARFSRANLKKNVAFTEELLRLVAIFQQNGISIAAVRGPVLAETLYGDLALREFCDLDIMVPEAELGKAGNTLIACGYRPALPDKWYRSALSQYMFQHNQTGILVDLHCRQSRKGMGFPFQVGEIWPRLREVTIAGRPVPTLANDDLALFLAVHGTEQEWRRLIWVCDFAELLRKCRNINWMTVLERAQRAQSSRPLLLAHFLAHSLLDGPAPVEVVGKVADDSTVRALAEEVQSAMLRIAAGAEPKELLNAINRFEGLRQRLWCFATLLTTRTVDIVMVRIRKSLSAFGLSAISSIEG